MTNTIYRENERADLNSFHAQDQVSNSSMVSPFISLQVDDPIAKKLPCKRVKWRLVKCATRVHQHLFDHLRFAIASTRTNTRTSSHSALTNGSTEGSPYSRRRGTAATARIELLRSALGPPLHSHWSDAEAGHTDLASGSGVEPSMASIWMYKLIWTESRKGEAGKR